MTEDEELWAEAMVLEQEHGFEARYIVVAQAIALKLVGDEAGLARLLGVGNRLEQLRKAKRKDRKPQ